MRKTLCGPSCATVAGEHREQQVEVDALLAYLVASHSSVTVLGQCASALRAFGSSALRATFMITLYWGTTISEL
jgi:hypothetical protein